jgi:P27 family predicted phage terminase small subunit
LCRQLEARRCLTKADGEILALYATTHARWRKAMDDVELRGEVVISVSKDKYGETIERQRKNPWLLIAQESEKAMVAILDRAGLSPLNRERVKPVKQEEKNIPFEVGSVGWILEQAKLKAEETENAN